MTKEEMMIKEEMDDELQIATDSVSLMYIQDPTAETTPYLWESTASGFAEPYSTRIRDLKRAIDSVRANELIHKYPSQVTSAIENRYQQAGDQYASRLLTDLLMAKAIKTYPSLSVKPQELEKAQVQIDGAFGISNESRQQQLREVTIDMVINAVLAGRLEI